MGNGPNITNVAALVGDHARAQVLTALMSGQALTATELADAAGVTRQTASSHLARLVDGGLLAVEAQGRHRYFRLADEDVAHMLESLMGVACRTAPARVRTGPREPALRKARVCYDHLAGELGVLMYDNLVRAGALALSADGVALTAAGNAMLREIGIDTEALGRGRSAACRTCLDWSERRHHLSGAAGRALLARFEELGWARRVTGTRVVEFGAGGEDKLRAWSAAAHRPPGRVGGEPAHPTNAGVRDGAHARRG